MKRILSVCSLLLLLNTYAEAQRMCGIEAEKAAMIAHDPTWAAKFAAQRDALQGIADAYKQSLASTAERSTSVISPVPVIFHIMVTASQLATIGGIAGVQQRCDSQIVVLNRDYNRGNLDSGAIPDCWKPLFGYVGVQFGLAHTTPSGTGTPGYEILIIPDAVGGYSSYPAYAAAKSTASGGLDAWDNTKYLNVWCLNFNDVSGLLGSTCPRSFVGGGGITNAEMGVCINYEALGKRASPADSYIATGWGADYYDLGRTLTHEIGHFFEIWHTWGDDDGKCPWDPTGNDDGLADTPPEDDHKYYAIPDAITCGTVYDGCRYDTADHPAVDTQLATYGIADHDYMNYVDDIAMLMFTKDQAAAMAAMVLVPPTSGTGPTGSGTIGESYSLTQHPILLTYPANTLVNQADLNNTVDVAPNPTTGIINVTYNRNISALLGISVTNILGQEVANTNTTGMAQDYYSIDLSGMSKGIYFVRCNFASGSITRKILLQ